MKQRKPLDALARIECDLHARSGSLLQAFIADSRSLVYVPPDDAPNAEEEWRLWQEGYLE